MAEKRMFIYKITNTYNNKIYIGRTVSSINKRLKEHFNDSKYILNNCPLHKDMKIYKNTFFKIEKIFEFNVDNLTKKLMNKIADNVEYDYICKYNAFYPNGYNVRRCHNAE